MIAVFFKVRACFGHQTEEGCPGEGKQAEDCNLANCPGCDEQQLWMILVEDTSDWVDWSVTKLFI